MTYIQDRHLVVMSQQPRCHYGQQLCPIAQMPVIAACFLVLLGQNPFLKQKSKLVVSELNTKHIRRAPAPDS